MRPPDRVVPRGTVVCEIGSIGKLILCHYVVYLLGCVFDVMTKSELCRRTFPFNRRLANRLVLFVLIRFVVLVNLFGKLLILLTSRKRLILAVMFRVVRWMIRTGRINRVLPLVLIILLVNRWCARVNVWCRVRLVLRLTVLNVRLVLFRYCRRVGRLRLITVLVSR